jgi:hypothetical protein
MILDSPGNGTEEAELLKRVTNDEGHGTNIKVII